MLVSFYCGGIQSCRKVIFNKSTAHGCWTLDFIVSDIKPQAIYKVIHTSNLSTDWGDRSTLSTSVLSFKLIALIVIEKC
jgi:hypothetical protein